MFTVNYAGNQAGWELTALNAYDWLPVATALLILYLLAVVLVPTHRPMLLKVVELLIYAHIGLFVFELWQNSASFPPISTRQYIIEVSKFMVTVCALLIVILTVRKKLLALVNS